MSEPLEMIKHDDGTVTLHFASLSAGLLRIERLSNIEMYNLLREYEVCDGDGGPLLLKWAQGFRDSDPHELADCGDDLDDALRGDIASRWGPSE